MSHHRKHATTHLVCAAEHTKKVISAFTRFVNQRQITTLDKANAPLLQHTGNIARDITKLVDIVAEGDLDIARSLISQPSKTERSLLYEVRTAIYYAARLIKSEEGRGKNAIADCILELGEVWRYLDMSEWHIIDGIREEKYNDPDFME